jgi:PTS system nitrogen regulatory IIA component
MNLTVRQAATYLHVDESTVRQWIAKRALPAHRVNEGLRLNALELWEWATEQGVPVSRSLLDQARKVPEPIPPLSALLTAGGIHHDVGGQDKAGVLAELVARLPLPAEVDRGFLASVLEAREAMGSTGIGDGIAIPHVRNPILLHVREPFVTLCLLRRSVEFGAIDGRPVHALFNVVSPNVPTHLRILAQIAFILRDAELRRLLRERANAAAIMERVRVIEEQVGPPTGSIPIPRRTK